MCEPRRSGLCKVHGSGGGYDQGLLFARPLADRGFRVLGTPAAVGYERGGHLWVGHHGELLDEIASVTFRTASASSVST